MAGYKNAVIFLLTYLALYIVLNTAYALFIEYYRPGPDALTRIVTKHSTILLSTVEENVTYMERGSDPQIPILNNGTPIVEVYEGCNGANVMIVYASFLFAFRGPFRQTLPYLFGGLTAIYMVNLFRVAGLYGVSSAFPQHLYFFHKFFFTGVIYLFVFGLWFLWVQRVKKWKAEGV